MPFDVEFPNPLAASHQPEYAQRPIERSSSFLDNISLRHDAPEVLAQFLLTAEMRVRALGVRLEFGSFEELRSCNQANRATWRPLVPTLDHTCNEIDTSLSFCILGRDQDGNVVATQAARMIDLRGTNLKAEAESMRLFYDGSPPQDLSVLLSAPSAESISGNVVYSGGVWYHPRFRRQGLATLLPRMSRALAFGTWNADLVLSFVEDPLLRKDMASKYGYPRFERHFLLTDDRAGDVLFAGGLIWISRAETLKDLRSWINGQGAEIDVVPHARRA